MATESKHTLPDDNQGVYDDAETEQSLSSQEAGTVQEPPHKSKGQKNPLTREQIADAEKTGGRKPSFYRRVAAHEGKRLFGFVKPYEDSKLKRYVKKQKKLIMMTLLINLLVAAALLIVLMLSPLKHLHFETILRSVNFARYQLLVRKQFSKIIFNAAVLTDESVGEYRRSPLIRQIMLTNPDRQVKALGRDGRLKFEFYPGRQFGKGLLPEFGETLKAVVVDGKRVDLDQMSRDLFGGRSYHELQLREKMTMQSRFVNAVHFEMGDIMALQPRTVRWNPYLRLRLRADLHLIKWFNGAREYLGKTPPQARALTTDETVERVMTPDDRRSQSGSSDINEDADQRRAEVIEARKTGRSPGAVRSQLATRVGRLTAVSDTVFAVTVTCIVRDLAIYFTNGQAEREMQALRFAGDLMTTTDQQKAGETVGEAIGGASSFWDSDGTTPEPTKHPMYGMAVGEPYAPSPENDKLMLSVPLLSYGRFFEDINKSASNFLDGGLIGLLTGKVSNFQRKATEKACSFMLDEDVQTFTALAELVLTALSLGTIKGVTAGIKAAAELGFHAAVGYGLGELLNWLIGMAVESYAQTAFSLEQGADRFAAGYVAQNYAAQTGTRNVNVGRPLSQAETNESQEVAMETLRQHNRESSFANRYFAIDNPFSLLGQVVARIPSSGGGLVNTMHNTASFIGTILSSPFKIIGSLGHTGLLFTPAKAAQSAATNTNFGVEQWGWSEAEQRRIDTDPNFELVSVISRVEPRLDELDARYGKCYDTTAFVLQYERPEECTREFLSAGHPDYGDDALYWRYYNYLMFAATHLTGPV